MEKQINTNSKFNITNKINEKIIYGGNSSKSRFTIYVLFTLAVVIPITIAIIFQKPPQISEKVNEKTENTGFNPQVLIGQNTKVRGKILSTEFEEKNYKYFLAGSNKEVLAYLFSSKIDLSTSESFSVEVMGSITGNYNGSMVIRVDELVLK
jgi:hypothetical protein